jgi:hypothetical protein
MRISCRGVRLEANNDLRLLLLLVLRKLALLLLLPDRVL